MDIGQKLKELRIQAGLTQEELADRSELTKGFISQIERNLTSPSLATFFNILDALGKEPEEFFRSMWRRQVVFKPDDYIESENESMGNIVKWIVPKAQRYNMEPIILELQPGGLSKTVIPFEGEAFGYLIEGEDLILHYGEDKFKLKQGECFYLLADQSHWVENIGKSRAVLLWVCDPPNF
ncbi:helix-turn-helix domain-containing protein [Peptoniphilus sp. GNH]|nr:DNA-binding helix-turn-helix protein [Clostridiales bacterium KA00134]UHR03078.1 helix-turn-helix domain-containing protein [Peptoniphilus sp. GNH]